MGTATAAMPIMASGRPRYIWTNRMPSAYPWPGVERKVMALAWVAMMARVTEYQRMRRPARRYSWRLFAWRPL